MLEKQGAFDANVFTFAWESQGDKKFDYSFSCLPEEYPGDVIIIETMTSNCLYLQEGDYTAHNHMSFGNYLWAATGYIVGFDYTSLQLGAHANSLLNSSRNGYGSQLDSKDDQLSIIKGIFHAQNHQYRERKK